MNPSRILAGALALIVLGTVVQPDASKRVGQLITTVTGFGRRFLDPAVPAIGAAPKSSKDQSGIIGGGQNLFGSLLDGLPIIGGALGGILGVSTPAASSTTPQSSPPAASSLPLPTVGPSTSGHVLA